MPNKIILLTLVSSASDRTADSEATAHP